MLALPAISFLVACFAYSSPAYAAQTVPYKVNFQGRITNASGTVLPSGTYNMRFRIYSVATGGTAQWTESRLVSAAQGVTVTNGLFSVQLGDIAALSPTLFTTQDLYFEIELPTLATATGSSPSWTEGAMTPRSKLGAAAYAINSDTLDGYDSSYFAPATGSTAYAPISGSTNYAPYSGSTNYAPISGSTNYIQNQTAAAQGAGFNISGNGTIGGTGTITGSLTNRGAATFYNSTNSTTAFTIQTSGAAKLFVADTTNSRIYIGDPTADANAILLVLDSKTGTGDPTGVNGAEYYNSTNNKFRCYQNSIWQDCGNGFNTITKTADQAATANSTTFQDDNTLYFAVKASTTYVFDAWIPVNDSNASADLKYTFTTPSGATMNILTSYYRSATTFVQCNIVTSGQTCANTTVNRADHFIQVRGHVTVGTTAGNVRFRFAQNSAVSGQSFPVIKKGATLSWHQSN